MKVALLVSDDPHQEYLVGLLGSQFDISGVIVETGRAQIARLRKRRRFRDWGWRRYHGLRRKLSGHASYRKRYFASPPAHDPRHETVEVGWINSDLAISTMARWSPDVAIVCGTNFVKKEVLKPAGRAFNIHAGCLPHYRGNHGIFFAFAEGRHELIGATLHEVSPQLDCGAIVEVVHPPLYPGDDDETLYCRADQIAMLRLVEVLRLLGRGEDIQAVPQPDTGRVFRHRDRSPWLEFGFWLRRLLGRAPLRCRPITQIETTLYDLLGAGRLADPLIEYRKLKHDASLHPTTEAETGSADR